ncbi:glycosyltransferase family 29 protein [Limimaricola sp. G21655-S1]|uniref:glycosyltransferase family 29 protein n=1 Tax=Limimaricola sp. G21655-S1 TaxID=3014768 RepID=UPI0022AFAD06|nr:glycosyltransferase family 29 protein [Limimaricola sp. G21655-S1]MCZ4262922.1 glycosyltransferase family 29 protein [Limimaricola sp. G21655-S1]
MNRIVFEIAKRRGDEMRLSRIGLSEAALLSRLAGRRVALVGNARSLAEKAQGPEIDAADIVIRLNTAPMPDPASHGTRTDWLAMSIPVPQEAIAARAPELLLWMTPKRKRLPWRVAQAPGFALLPAIRAAALRDELGARPTTGMLAIDLLARSDLASARLHGFDFFASKSLSGGRGAADVPHDFAAERDRVAALIAADPRFSLA